MLRIQLDVHNIVGLNHVIHLIFRTQKRAIVQSQLEAIRYDETACHLQAEIGNCLVWIYGDDNSGLNGRGANTRPAGEPQLSNFVCLAKEYRELNGGRMEVLDSPPSPLQFSRLVHISRPVLIKGCKHLRPEQWSREHLVYIMGDNEISVAVTPHGQGADALVIEPDGATCFAEPCVEKVSMRSFLDRLADQQGSREALYLQSQNGNLYPNEPSEFELLRQDVPTNITWASKALGRSPEAVNLWIGNERSVTSLHCDPYENIYTVVRGAKHFTLFPPTEAFYLDEQSYKHARYTRSTSSSPLTLTPSTSGNVRWSSITDPTLPESTPGASPLQVSVRTGETLYLPPGWWHHVRQSGDESGICVALNWWYDMEMRGMHWVWLQCLRGTLTSPEGEEVEPFETGS